MNTTNAYRLHGNTPVIRLSDKPYLTQEEACIFTGLSKSTLLRAKRSGALKAKVLGKTVFYKPIWLEQWMDSFPDWEPINAF